VKIVISGAGAAAIACTKLLINYGADSEKIILCDSKEQFTMEEKIL
jgi:malate dehydrogenase (oxaloacetate-decarboxylating)(NADP+)